MGLFSKAKEALRDKTRDNVCARLNGVGVEARLVERGVKEEIASRPPWFSSLGLIEISKSPTLYMWCMCKHVTADTIPRSILFMTQACIIQACTIKEM